MEKSFLLLAFSALLANASPSVSQNRENTLVSREQASARLLRNRGQLGYGGRAWVGQKGRDGFSIDSAWGHKHHKRFPDRPSAGGRGRKLKYVPAIIWILISDSKGLVLLNLPEVQNHQCGNRLLRNPQRHLLQNRQKHLLQQLQKDLILQP
jgi:hypothetical protein